MAPLSKNKIKYIHSLEQKKIRKEERVFLAEGPKAGRRFTRIFSLPFLAATSLWLQSHPNIYAGEIAEVSQEELSRASLLKTPQQVLAILEQPQYTLTPDIARHSLCLALDDVQDPGNLGTIIRLADWFGIEDIICSQNTVDVYNPKTVQATMGGIARVRVHYIFSSNVTSGYLSANQRRAKSFSKRKTGWSKRSLAKIFRLDDMRSSRSSG